MSELLNRPSYGLVKAIGDTSERCGFGKRDEF